jgi:probable rRNA maturation factor
MPSDQPDVAISNRQDLPVVEDELARLAAATLRGEGVSGAELSVSLVTEGEMAELHERYMGEPGPSDVLSFPMDEPNERDNDGRVLGDVVICPEYAATNNPDLSAELRLLLVHGILHLLGYDHETEPDRTAMWACQERYSGVQSPSGEEEAAG